MLRVKMADVEDLPTRLLMQARALVLADLAARAHATPAAVSALEDACSERRWWLEQWPEGAAYIAGLVAQDVQDALLELVGRWPLCLDCGAEEPSGPSGTAGLAGRAIDPRQAQHSLYIQPDLGGPDPVWVCEETGHVVAALGHLGRGTGG